MIADGSERLGGVSVPVFLLMLELGVYALVFWFLARQFLSSVGQPGSSQSIYRVIHKSFRDFRTRLRNKQDRHGRKEHTESVQ